MSNSESILLRVRQVGLKRDVVKSWHTEHKLLFPFCPELDCAFTLGLKKQSLKVMAGSNACSYLWHVSACVSY